MPIVRGVQEVCRLSWCQNFVDLAVVWDLALWDRLWVNLQFPIVKFVGFCPLVLRLLSRHKVRLKLRYRQCQRCWRQYLRVQFLLNSLFNDQFCYFAYLNLLRVVDFPISPIVPQFQVSNLKSCKNKDPNTDPQDQYAPDQPRNLLGFNIIPLCKLQTLNIFLNYRRFSMHITIALCAFLPIFTPWIDLINLVCRVSVIVRVKVILEIVGLYRSIVDFA